MTSAYETVASRFQTFLLNLKIDKQDFITETFKNITREMNLFYLKSKSDSRNAYFVGSYGRGTAIKGVSNINMMVRLPPKLKDHYHKLPVNGQMQLLQDVRDMIDGVYKTARIDEEWHLMVDLPFGLMFEVVPVFSGSKKNYIYPDPQDGGIWKEFNPLREIQVLNEYNYIYNGKIKHLARMMRAWKSTHDVPISGMLLDTLVLNFMDEWEGNQTSYYYYGKMCQDFLEYLAGRKKDQLQWYAKGSNRELPAPDDFGHKANIFYKTALKANEYEAEQAMSEANLLWKEIFGELFPL